MCVMSYDHKNTQEPRPKAQWFNNWNGSLATNNISKVSDYQQGVRNVTWIHDPRSGESSFFKLSRKRPKIFSTQAVSCCLKSIAGYLASTCNTPSSYPINFNGDFGP